MPPLPWRKPAATSPAEATPPSQPVSALAQEPYQVYPIIPIGLESDRQRAAAEGQRALVRRPPSHSVHSSTGRSLEGHIVDERESGRHAGIPQGFDAVDVSLELAASIFSHAHTEHRQNRGGTPEDLPVVKALPANRMAAQPNHMVVRDKSEIPSHLVPVRGRRSRGAAVVTTLALLGGFGGGGYFGLKWWNGQKAAEQGFSAQSLVIPEGAAVKNGAFESLKDAPILTFTAKTSAKTQWNFTSPQDPTKLNGMTDKPDENMFRTNVPWSGVLRISAPYDADPTKSAVSVKDKVATVDYSKVTVSLIANPSEAAKGTDRPPFFDRINCKKNDTTNPYEKCIENVYKLFLDTNAPAKELVPPNLTPSTVTHEMAAQAVIKYILQKYDENQTNMINEAIASGIKDLYSGENKGQLLAAVKAGIKKAYGLNNSNAILSVIEKNEDSLAKQGDAATTAYLTTSKTDTRTVQLVTKAVNPDQPDPTTTIIVDERKQQ